MKVCLLETKRAYTERVRILALTPHPPPHASPPRKDLPGSLHGKQVSVTSLIHLFIKKRFPTCSPSPSSHTYLAYIVNKLTSNVEMQIHGYNNGVRILYRFYGFTERNCTRILPRLCDIMVIFKAASLECLL